MFENNDINLLLDSLTDILADKLAERLNKSMPEQTTKAYKPDDLLSTPKAAKMLGLAASTLRNWREKSIVLPFVFNKETGKYYYKYSDLLQYKEKNKRLAPLK